MRKFCFLVFALFASWAINAQTTVIDIGAIDTAYTTTFNEDLVIDVATTTSKVASPKVSFTNPFKGLTFSDAQISFDVYTYHPDSIKVLGCLLSIFDATLGRMYFSNGSYLGYNAVGGWFDANLKSYAVDSDFIGTGVWKNIKLQFTATGYAMYVDNVLAFDQSSTDVTIGGTLTEYSNVLSFLQNASTLVIGTGSWWSDNTRDDGTYWDCQFSYLKNIKFTPNFSQTIDISAIDTAYTTTFNEDLVIDVAKTTSKVAAPKLSFTNPFKGLTFSEAQISFDVYTYHPDSIKVLGCLLSIFDATLGRMYFSNGSYLGYNAVGGWFDANLKSYAMDSDFIGTGVWKNIKLQFTGTGYAMYVDNMLAFNQSSTDVTIGGSLTDYSKVISFLQNASSLVIGTGSWWSDNTRDDGTYWDCQFSYLKNINCTPNFSQHLNISEIDTAYTTTFDNNLVIDVAKTASKIAAPKLWYPNPFKGKSFASAEVSFDVYTYHPDSIKVLGCLMAFYDNTLGRMYFSNGSYLGYNAIGGWFDANLKSYAVDSDFIGTGVWKNIKLQFTATGYAMYVDNVLAFNQSSTDVTISGSLTNYNNVITFLQNADTLVIGTGSWWSDNTRDDGTYWDCQYSYLKNINFTPVESKVTVLPVEHIVFGSVDSPEDFTGKVTMSWDADSLYMVYDCVDDSIVNMGASYQVDNIEIYFDMDNSKNIHWPRNGGWVQAVDAAYDTNDYQLRLVPDVPFVTNNTAKPGISISDTSVNQVYTRTENGYQFVLNIAWQGLMAGFEPVGGKQIGFDVLWSDNDKTASDANRNQITWNSPTAYPFNDPSLFGVLEFVAAGYFNVIPDEENPTAPATVTATLSGSDVVLTWDAATDNRVVQQYIIMNNTAAVQAVDTILAKQTDNTYTVTGLKQGKKYTFGIVAVDVYGHKSTKTNAAEIQIPVGIEQLTASGMMVYPNPSNGLFNISSESNSAVLLEVYNLTGGRVASTVFTQNYMLDLTGFSKGVYFLHLSAEGKTVVTKLIVQ
jgi:Carbohydrate family 9 binding domain-like/Secretion system C-terminal sorting domain/Fibronectin type III domain